MMSLSMQPIPACLSLCVVLHQHAQFFKQMHPRSGLASVLLLLLLHSVLPPFDRVLPIQMPKFDEYSVKHHIG